MRPIVDTISERPHALTTRFADFWLLGGASLLVWFVMFATQGFRAAWAIDQHFKNPHGHDGLALASRQLPALPHLVQARVQPRPRIRTSNGASRRNARVPRRLRRRSRPDLDRRRRANYVFPSCSSSPVQKLMGLVRNSIRRVGGGMGMEIDLHHFPAGDPQFRPGFRALVGHAAARLGNRERFRFCRWADNFRAYPCRSGKPPLEPLSQPTPSVNVSSPSIRFRNPEPPAKPSLNP
jgi:hypothetical protein